MRKLLMSFCTFWNFSPQSFVYPIISFVCLIISPQSFVWLITMYKLKGNYSVGSKRLCSTDFFNEVSLIFVHMVCTGKFLLQMLQTKFASIYWISSVFDVCSGGLVDFKFGIDLAKKSVNMQFYGFFQRISCHQEQLIDPKHWKQWKFSCNDTER